MRVPADRGNCDDGDFLIIFGTEAYHVVLKLIGIDLSAGTN